MGVFLTRCFIALLVITILTPQPSLAADFALFGESASPTPLPASEYATPSTYGTPAGGGGGGSGGDGGGGGGSQPSLQNGLSAKYFDNDNLTGAEISVIDPFINYNWGSKAPYPQMGKDTFSVSWTGSITAPQSGKYTFYAATDDGVRVYINNQLIINSWRVKGTRQVKGNIDLTAGQNYTIKVEYFERTRNAQAKLYWSATARVDKTYSIGRIKYTRKQTVTVLKKQIVPSSAFFVM